MKLNPIPMNLLALVREAQKSVDEDAHVAAVHNLITEIYSEVEAYVSMHVPKKDDAPDVVQKTVIDIARGIKEFKGEKNEEYEFRCWWRVIARRKIVDVLRKEARLRPTADEELYALLEAGSEGTGLPASVLADYMVVLRALKSLGAPCFHFITCRYELGMSHEEIGEQYGMKPNAIGMALRRCIAVLRETLQE